MQVWTGQLARMAMNRHPGPPPLIPASCNHGGQVSTSGRRADAEGGAARCQRSARSSRCNPSQTWVQPAASKVTRVMGGRSREEAEPQAQAHTNSLGSTGTTVDPELWECPSAPGADEQPPCWLSAALVGRPHTRRRNEHPFRRSLSCVLLSIARPCFPKSRWSLVIWKRERDRQTQTSRGRWREERGKGKGKMGEGREKETEQKDKRRLCMVRNLGNWRGRKN